MSRRVTARAVLRVTAGAVAILAVGALAFLGGRQSISAASGTEESQTASELVWTVKEESIGRSLTFVGTLAASSVPGPLANVEGIVTGMPIGSGAVVKTNDVLLTVALRPVVAGQGSTPAFRDLQEGDRGSDVRQLRQFMCDVGHGACGAGEEFTAALTRAVTAWQKRLGVEADGVVRAGDIMWFTRLPVSVVPASATTAGGALAATDRPFMVAAGTPRLTVPVTAEQAALVPAGSIAHIGALNAVVTGAQPAPAETAEADSGDSGALALVLTAKDGKADLCAANACAALLAGKPTVNVEVSIDVVPKRTGLGVPVRAIQTAADDTTYVLKVDGTQASVTVLGSAGGMAVVDGLTAGMRIRVDDAPA